MQKFSEWLNENHPDFVDEGFISKITPLGKKIVGAANAGIGGLGVFSRFYAPMLAGGTGVEPQLPPLSDKPAMVAKADMPATSKGIRLTGNKMLDDLGNSVGHPDSQGWYDAADWIPTANDDDARVSRQKEKDAAHGQKVTAFLDPNWRPRVLRKRK